MLVITLGDPFSTNVEAVAKILRTADKPRHPIVLVGSHWHWKAQVEQLGLTTAPFEFIDALRHGLEKGLYFFDVDATTSHVSAEQLAPNTRGQLALAALHALRPLELDQPLAVVTGPINKAVCVGAGFQFPGQTEFFQNLWDHPALMLLAGPKLRVGLTTNHLALKDVPKMISANLVRDKARLLGGAMKQLYGIERPRVGVLALNPHAGDSGSFGTEDQGIIAPAVEELRQEGLYCTGPLPADTAFFKALNGEYDAVLAMYHDQGLGPLKTVHFDTAVNISAGLPALRVSPDHGPAADLFLQGKVSIRSWQTAFDLASDYLEAQRVQSR